MASAADTATLINDFAMWLYEGVGKAVLVSDIYLNIAVRDGVKWFSISAPVGTYDRKTLDESLDRELYLKYSYRYLQWDTLKNQYPCLAADLIFDKIKMNKKDWK